RSALPSPARQENENETRLGTKRRLFTLPPFAAADRGEDNRLSEVHDRRPPFRRHIPARAILRRRHANAVRLRACRCCAAFWSLRQRGTRSEEHTSELQSLR